MALKLRNTSTTKDIKKSSYYVWFLGAKESKGIRGSEYIIPVIKHLEEREKDIEPFKVTLQISSKGLKIIQNITKSLTKPKNETIKHFIPHNTISYVYQKDDIIACILLLFNPVTKCPIHIHAYRCDSIETATILKQQLQQLIDKPENQKKFNEIELKLKREKKFIESSIGSDGDGTTISTRESLSSEERFSLNGGGGTTSGGNSCGNNNNINGRGGGGGGIPTLYDSVAAELKEKLNKNKVPILLPPRDYDTVHRQKGNLNGIDLRRCLNKNIVGQNVKNNNNHRRPIESSGGSSGIGSDHPPSPESPTINEQYHHNITSDEEDDWNGDPADTTLYMVQGAHVTLPRPAPRVISPQPPLSSHSPPSTTPNHYNRHRSSQTNVNNQNSTNAISTPNLGGNQQKYLERSASKYSDKYKNRQKSLERSKSMDRSYGEGKFYQNKGDDFDRRYRQPVKYYQDDDGFDENIRHHKPRFSLPPDFQNDSIPVPKIRQKYYENSGDGDGGGDVSTPYPTSPRDRFRDAQQKFQQMVECEPPISPAVKPLRRHESMYMYESSNNGGGAGGHHHRQSAYIPPSSPPRSPLKSNDNLLTNYNKYDPKRRSMFNLIEEEHRKNSNEIAKELKRRSYLGGSSGVANNGDGIGGLHHINNGVIMANNRNNELSERDRYNNNNNNEYSKSTYDLDKLRDDERFIKSLKNHKIGGFRHSYAEPPPKLRIDKGNGGGGKKLYPEMLQRTNSVSNNGRVGIASVHPY